MRNLTLISLAVGAVALAFAAGAYAQTSDTDDGTDPSTTGPAFVDADGDGINDNVAQMHQARNRVIKHAFLAHQRRQMHGLAANLTTEQKAQLEQTVNDLRAQGATREQIHAAVGETLQSFGVTLPATWNMTPKEFAAQFRLTPEQRAEVRTLVETMKSEGKSGEEIRAAVAAKYQEWGKMMPPRRVHAGQHGGSAPMSN